MHGTDAGRSKVRGPGVTRGNSMYGSREVREEQEVREERVRVRVRVIYGKVKVERIAAT